MINIIKQEIEVDIELKKRINFICVFCNTTPTFINGSIRNIYKTNISYVEPHKVIINENYIEIKSICNIPMPIDLNVAYAEYIHQ